MKGISSYKGAPHGQRKGMEKDKKFKKLDCHYILAVSSH